MLNCINLVGRLGEKPEIKWLDSGKAKVSVSVATERPTKNEDKKTDWHKVELWGKTAENFAEYADKGRLVAFTGSLEYNVWETNEGQKRKDAIVVARDFKLLDSKKDAQEGQQGAGNGPRAAQGHGNVSDALESEIPF